MSNPSVEQLENTISAYINTVYKDVPPTDTGYRIIIILAGLQENLRKQTQERLDAEFSGRKSEYYLDPKAEQGIKNQPVGVGRYGTSKKIASFTSVTNDSCREAAKYILERNILCGDALTMLRNDGTPIVFSQWDLVSGNKIKRRDYRLDQLMKGHDEQMDIEMLLGGWEFDEEINAWVPAPIADFPVTNYWEVQNVTEP